MESRAILIGEQTRDGGCARQQPYEAPETGVAVESCDGCSDRGGCKEPAVAGSCTAGAVLAA